MSAVIIPSSSTSFTPPATSTTPATPAPPRFTSLIDLHRDLQQETVLVIPWRDDVVEASGHDPRSQYVERFWLGILGPSTTWFLRSLAWGLDASPDGFQVSFADMAHAMGLGGRVGRHSPFMKAVHRAAQFELVSLQQRALETPHTDTDRPAPPEEGDATCPSESRQTILCARRKMPWLSRRMTASLPTALQHEHHLWVEASTSTRKRAG